MEEGNPNGIYSKRIRAGSRRTYFLDVRTTKSNDYYLTITESKKRFNDDGYERHKVFLYKEDFNKFLEALTETINYVKTELLPDYDFDEFSHKDDKHYDQPQIQPTQDPKTEVSKEVSDDEKIKPEELAENAPDMVEEQVAEVVGEESAVNTSNSDPKITQEADDLKWD